MAERAALHRRLIALCRRYLAEGVDSTLLANTWTTFANAEGELADIENGPETRE
jgi:hypothetical protein